LTRSGKVDRRGLPAPELGARAAGRAYAAPASALERVLAELWGEVLGVPAGEVGAQDNFFELGGHSLLATQLVARVREHLQTELPLRHVFEAPTVAGLAEALLDGVEDRAAIERTAELLLMLADLSDEEAEAMLQNESTATLIEQAPDHGQTAAGHAIPG
jgi:acyl carrier protein